MISHEFCKQNDKLFVEKLPNQQILRENFKRKIEKLIVDHVFKEKFIHDQVFIKKIDRR